MSEAQVQDRGEQSLLVLPRPQSARLPSQGMTGDAQPSADAGKHSVRARAPTPPERPGGERRIVELPPEREDQEGEDQHPDQDREGGDEPHKGLLRRHKFASVIGLLLSILAAAGSYLYWDNARHFETTDD